MAQQKKGAAKADAAEDLAAKAGGRGGKGRGGKGGSGGGQRIAVDQVFYDRLRRLLKIVIPGVRSKVGAGGESNQQPALGLPFQSPTQPSSPSLTCRGARPGICRSLRC